MLGLISLLTSNSKCKAVNGNNQATITFKRYFDGVVEVIGHEEDEWE